MSVRLYVGNLPKDDVEREALQDMFADPDNSVSTKVIKDRKTGKCRGFAFVTVPTDELADQFIEKFNGQSFMDNPLKIEKALPRSKGKGKEETESESESGSSSPSPSAAVSEKPTPSNGAKARNSKRSKRNAPVSNKDTESFQPDPRWASELAKLKEMLAAQTSNT